jgi:hypothetical protein
MTTEKPKKPTSTDIKIALRTRYPAGQYALMFEVSNGTGAQIKRYADAVAMGMWASHGMEIEGIEIKISRADFKKELADHQKSDEVMRYCNRWWLACPKDLIKPDELPSTWGLLELQENGTLRQKIAAPKLKPIDLDRNFIAAMLRRHAQHGAEETHKLIAAGIAEKEKEIRDRYDRKYQIDVSHRNKRLAEAEKSFADIKEKTGIDLMDYSPTKTKIALLKFAESFLLKSNYGNLNLPDAADRLISVATEIKTIFEGVDDL